MRQPINWDRLESTNRIKGPIIVPIHEVATDPHQIDERTVKHYVKIDTQVWYFEPITCILPMGSAESEYEANGLYSHSQVEACRRLGYKDLQIIYVVVV